MTLSPATAIRRHIFSAMVTKPISLRLRNDEVTARARRTLRRMEKEITAQRRVRWCATKALNEVYQMHAAAEVRLKTLSDVYRDDWQENYKTLCAMLQKIRARGVL